MLKPICVRCRKFFRMKKSGFYFTEGMPKDSACAEWKPYKVWAGDLWECRGCGAEIVSGFGQQPCAEHYQEDFAAVRERLGAAQFQVNDG